MKFGNVIELVSTISPVELEDSDFLLKTYFVKYPLSMLYAFTLRLHNFRTRNSVRLQVWFYSDFEKKYTRKKNDPMASTKPTWNVYG